MANKKKKKVSRSQLQIDALRKRAEKILQSRPEAFKHIAFADIKDLVYELQTYEVELEMQNQELESSRRQVEVLKDKYVYLYDFAPCGYMTFDAKGLVEEANLTAAEMLRMDKRVLIGKPFSIFLADHSLQKFFGYLQSLLKKRKADSCEIMLKRSDGSSLFVRLEGRVVVAQEEMPPRIAAMMVDITERKEVEDFKRMDQIRKDFFSNMSHELRTPLNAIIGFSEVLIDKKFGPLNEAQEEYLRDIYESSKFLLSLINDILNLAKIEAGKMELAVSGFSLKELLKNSLVLVKENASRHQIELSLDIAEGVGFIWADERKVRQIVFNLLSNAVKFTPDGGRVGIKAKINGLVAEVDVWDNGIGIAPEDQGKLFRPFMQIESFSDKRYEGTGIGLSLTKELVELHKGKIWVESEGKGNGSSFKFSLPIGAAA